MHVLRLVSGVLSTPGILSSGNPEAIRIAQSFSSWFESEHMGKPLPSSAAQLSALVSLLLALLQSPTTPQSIATTLNQIILSVISSKLPSEAVLGTLIELSDPIWEASLRKMKDGRAVAFEVIHLSEDLMYQQEGDPSLNAATIIAGIGAAQNILGDLSREAVLRDSLEALRRFRGHGTFELKAYELAASLSPTRLPPPSHNAGVEVRFVKSQPLLH